MRNDRTIYHISNEFLCVRVVVWLIQPQFINGISQKIGKTTQCMLCNRKVNSIRTKSNKMYYYYSVVRGNYEFHGAVMWLRILLLFRYECWMSSFHFCWTIIGIETKSGKLFDWKPLFRIMVATKKGWSSE